MPPGTTWKMVFNTSWFCKYGGTFEISNVLAMTESVCGCDNKYDCLIIT